MIGKMKTAAVSIVMLSITAAGALAQVPSRGAQVLNQATSFATVTPSDTAILTIPTKGIYIGDASPCDVALVGAQDQAAEVFANMATGVVLPLSFIRLMSTNTTCTEVKGLW